MTTSGQTTLLWGWTNPLTGIFGAHPILGGPLNLNDGVTFTLVSPEGLELSPPRKTIIPTGNIRSQGERVTRATYRENREAVARFILGPAATYAALATDIRQVVSWLDAALATPITIKWQPPAANSPVYLDVVASAHSIPADERDWVKLQLEPVELAFSVRPALRGDRVWLQNLAMNPGFGAVSGLGVAVFSDTFANANAYSVAAGSAPSVAANVMTVQNGSTITFGSPSWGAINQLRFRFQWVTGLACLFYFHFVNSNNYLRASFSAAGTFALSHVIAGVSTTLASSAQTPVNSTFYWMTLTQFPSVSGNPPLVQAVFSADATGSIGATIDTLGPATTADATTALTGKAGFGASGANLAIGGAFSNVLTVSLFGPGAWVWSPNLSSATGQASGAWEQSVANTYPGGPTTSWGAGRVDLPPAGTVDCGWRLYTGGAPTGALAAMPVSTAGDTLQAAAWVRSSGLNANAQLRLVMAEFDGTGTQLRSTTIATLNGNQASWMQMTGSLTTGASCAYADLLLRIVDTAVSGESANATVWWDNCQVWDQTLTGAGAGAMPYCELRFPQSPSQLTVSGLLGDLPAPALVAMGTYLASMAMGTALTWALARRGQASANGLMVGIPQGAQTANTGSSAPAITAVLDSASYGGYYLSFLLTNSGFNPRAFSFAAADMLGVFHLFSRAWTAEAGANLANVQTRVVTQQRSQAWFGLSTGADQIAAYNGPYTAPLTAGSAWQVTDSGQVNVPALPSGALVDPTQNYLTPRSQWEDLTSGGATFRAGWQALIPVDGSLLLGVVNNPSNSPGAVTTSWLWQYIDGLLTTRGGPGDGPAATYSVETASLQAVAHSGGGPGTQNTGAINVNLGADPFLTLDPQQSAISAAGTFAGVLGTNQLAGFMTDTAGDVLPLACDLIYTPLYHYPR
jgi:hypothetical protein